MDKRSTKERLVVIEIKLDDLCRHFTNHLSVHKQIIMTCLGIGLTGILSLICWVARFLWTLGH